MTINADSTKLDNAITLESDAGFYDDKQGLSVYTGKVVVEQGNMRLDADKVTVYMHEERQIYKLVAIGNPVKFKQSPELGKEDVHGHALVAEYLPETKLLVMTEKARVWQGQNSTASERIEYDRMSEIIKAGDEKSINQRVHVILQPNNNDTTLK